MRRIKLEAVVLIWGIAILGLIFPNALLASNHALLIGIGQYKDPKIKSLEGPKYDVISMEQVLSQQGFRKITTLIDAQATKKNILDQMKYLYSNSSPGDNIIIYFSGHGTSRQDRNSRLPLPHTSGAIIPYDFTYSPDDTGAAVISRLIVGKTDLRPILSQLDRDRNVLVVFDSCFSGNAVRAIGSSGIGNKRYVNLDFGSLRGNSIMNDEDIGTYDEGTIKVEPYPYKNIFFLSASSEFEPAMDVSKKDVGIENKKSTKMATFNMEPHGAFTDSFLKVVSAQGTKNADTNNDQKVTMDEMYKAITATVKENFRQTPQALPSTGPDVQRLRSNVFFTIKNKPVQAFELNRVVKVQVDAGLLEIRAGIKQTRDLTLSTTGPDLRILEDKGRILLALSNRHRICTFFDDNPGQIIQRTRQYAGILPLAKLEYPKQKKNVFLSLTGDSQKSIFKPGEKIGFKIDSEKPAYILLINIDPRGSINVLYPYYKEELMVLEAGKTLSLSGMFKIVAPHGTEVMKVFAFTKKPEGFDRIMGKTTIRPGSEAFADLSNMVFKGAGTREDVAQDVIRLTSYALEDFENN